MDNELFVKEMKILWNNLDNKKRWEFEKIIRSYFKIPYLNLEERADKIIEKLNEKEI